MRLTPDFFFSLSFIFFYFCLISYFKNLLRDLISINSKLSLFEYLINALEEVRQPHSQVIKILQYLWLVGRAKCLQQNNRENILSLRKQPLVVISVVSDYPPSSVINIFSNGQIYYPCHHSFAATLYLFLPPSLCLSAILLSPHNFLFCI